MLRQIKQAKVALSQSKGTCAASGAQTAGNRPSTSSGCLLALHGYPVSIWFLYKKGELGP